MTQFITFDRMRQAFVELKVYVRLITPIDDQHFAPLDSLLGTVNYHNNHHSGNKKCRIKVSSSDKDWISKSEDLVTHAECWACAIDHVRILKQHNFNSRITMYCVKSWYNCTLSISNCRSSRIGLPPTTRDCYFVSRKMSKNVIDVPSQAM